MSTIQVFLLGLMAGWMPSLIVLAWALMRAPLLSEPDQPWHGTE